MSIEREIELTEGQGELHLWQAYGLQDMHLLVPPTVYPPREDTALLDRVVAELGPGRGRHLLEIGCGSGAISIGAAIRGWRVSACDIHPLAVAASRGNAADHGYAANLEIREGGPGDGDGWHPSTGADLIIWNLPYLELEGEERLGPLEDAALIEAGGHLALLAALEAHPHILGPGGVVHLLHSSNALGARVALDWRQAGWATREVRRVDLGDERLTVIAAWRPFEGAPVEVVEACDSTNEEMLGSERPIGSLLRTASQPGGRGQHGRTWTDSPGGFMGSWNLPPDSIGEGAEHLQLAAGIAILDALACGSHAGLPSHGQPLSGLRLKPPNDVLLGSAKMAGVLAEGRTQGRRVEVVLGIGLNRIGPATDVPTAGWSQLFDAEVAEVSTWLHASIASVLEIHPLVLDTPRDVIAAQASSSC